MKRIMGIFLLSISICLSGCASIYSVKFNGYSDKEQPEVAIPEGASFCVLENKDARNPLFDAEIKSKIERLLRQKGYNLVVYDQAEFYLSFNYSMGQARVVTEVVPFYNPSETATVQTVTSTGKSRTSYVTYSGSTTYLPQKFTVYTPTLILEVIDAKLLRSAKQETKVWIGEAAYTTSEPDLRDTVNYLLFATFKHFGENTRRSMTIKVSGSDPKVKELIQ